jgi:uncharacterized alkaline shock family protein YloU
VGGILDSIEVLALVGPAGTGKSHRALVLAHEKKAELIIDDGLLIKGSRILAGRSAKSESLMITATRRALFMDPEHAREVKDKLEEEAPKRILILGISENMAFRIAENLGLPKPCEMIHIEQVATETEIMAARRLRMVDKKHAVPVVSVDVSRDSVGQLLDSFTVIFRRRNDRRILGENSVVRPRYSILGKISIADAVVKELASRAASTVPEVKKVPKVGVHMADGSVFLEVNVVLTYGQTWPPILKRVQSEVYQQISDLTGLEVKAVNVVLKNIEIPTTLTGTT